MKTAIAIVVFFVAGFIGLNYVCNYTMGGIEAGLPGGGHGKFADYHEDNLFSYYLSDWDEDYMPSFLKSDEDNAVVQGSTTSNPFVQDPLVVAEGI